MKKAEIKVICVNCGTHNKAEVKVASWSEINRLEGELLSLKFKLSEVEKENEILRGTIETQQQTAANSENPNSEKRNSTDSKGSNETILTETEIEDYWANLPPGSGNENNSQRPY